MHFEPVGSLARLLLIDGPYYGPCPRFKPVPLDDHLIQHMLFVSYSPDLKRSHGIDHGVVAARTLVGQDDASWCGLVGKEFTMANEIGPSRHSGKAFSRKISGMKRRGLNQLTHQARYKTTLL